MGVGGSVPQPWALRLYLRDPRGHGSFEDISGLQLRSREMRATRGVPIAHGGRVAGRADPQAPPFLFLHLQALLLLPKRKGREQSFGRAGAGAPRHREVVQRGAPGLQEGVRGPRLVPRGARRSGVEVRGLGARDGAGTSQGLAGEGLEGSA